MSWWGEIRSPSHSRWELRVTMGGRAVGALNELEYVRGKILANVWKSNEILVIDPASGVVEAGDRLRPVDDRGAPAPSSGRSAEWNRLRRNTGFAAGDRKVLGPPVCASREVALSVHMAPPRGALCRDMCRAPAMMALLQMMTADDFTRLPKSDPTSLLRYRDGIYAADFLALRDRASRSLHVVGRASRECG